MNEAEVIFYDGHCGLCHGFVRFILQRDRDGHLFQFSPLQGEAIKLKILEDERKRLPDSIVVLMNNGNVLISSSAVLYVLGQLGGGWKILSLVGKPIPLCIRDSVYEFIAKFRHRLFSTPSSTCPVLPPALSSRFLG